MAREASLEVERQWRLRLGRFSRSALSVAEFCRREQVSAPSFYNWRKRLAGTTDDGRETAVPATFLPVQVTASRSLQVAFPNGITLTLPADDHELIQRSIAAIAEARTICGDA